MPFQFKFFQILVGLSLFTLTSTPYVSNGNAKEVSKVDLNNQIRQGNFLIGLKPYLGGTNDSFSRNNKIKFATEDGFLKLRSLNGIEYRSKEINITWKKIPLDSPRVNERLIFGPYSSYESAQQKANYLKKKGLEASVAYPKNWEVWVPYDGNLPNEVFDYKIFKKQFNTLITPFLIDEYSSKRLKGPIYITAEETIKINDIDFGKRFLLIQDSYGTWTLVQEIKFDDYLKGVLPHEIGSNSPLEALKAQAVIARTWAIFNSKRFNMDNYHLCITTQCQVYKTPIEKNKNVQKAIKETSNLIITYQDKPINSFYHASNGGISAKASESWKIGDEPYFKNKIDGSKSLNKFFNLPIGNKNKLNSFLDLNKENFYGKNHSLFRWTKKITNKNIAGYLIKNKYINTSDKISGIKIIARGFSGRVTKLAIEINNSNQLIFLIKDDIRRILSFLPSNLFTINKLNDNLWLFRGGGFGHGVGLSQSGAIEMAKLGFTYEQILNHYYQGTKLKKIEISSQ